MKKVLLIVISFLLFILLIMMFIDFKKRKTSFLDTITILGEKYKLKPGIFVYEFDIKNNIIKKDDSGTGCQQAFIYKVSKIYENSYETSSGIQFFAEGQTYADFRIKFEKKNKAVAYYYFTINFDKPLEKEDGC